MSKVEFHPGELFPRVGFIVTNRSLPNERVLAFYNGRGTAEQHINWDGPGACTGGSTVGLSAAQLLDQLLNAPLVRCDEIAWSFAGLSMAGWNAICSIVLGIAALISARVSA